MKRGRKKIIAVLLAFLLNYLLAGFLDEAGGVKGLTGLLGSVIGSILPILPSPLGYFCFWTMSEGCFPVYFLPFYLFGALVSAIGLASVIAWIINLFAEDSDEEQVIRELKESVDALRRTIEENQRKAKSDSP